MNRGERRNPAGGGDSSQGHRPGPMITYAEDFPAESRAAVERAIAKAERRFGEYSRRRWDVEHVLDFVFDVFEAYVCELLAVAGPSRRRWSAEAVRTTAGTFLDGVIRQAYTTKAPPRTRHTRTTLLPGDITYSVEPGHERSLREFRAVVHQELRDKRVWHDLQELIEGLATTEPAPPTPSAGHTNDGDTDSRSARAERLRSYMAQNEVKRYVDIYRHPDVTVHRRDFDRWRAGRLPARSVMSQRIERLLARRPKGRYSG